MTWCAFAVVVLTQTVGMGDHNLPREDVDFIPTTVVRVLLDRDIDPALVESIRGEVVELFEQPGFAARAAEMSEWRRRELRSELQGCVPSVKVRTPLFEQTVRAKVLATVRMFVLLEKEAPATPRAIAQVAEVRQAMISRFKAEFPGIEHCTGWGDAVTRDVEGQFLYPQQSDMTRMYHDSIPEDVFTRVLAEIRPAASETPEVDSAWIRMNEAEREEWLAQGGLAFRATHWGNVAGTPFYEAIPQEWMDRRLKDSEEIGREAQRLAEELFAESRVKRDEWMREHLEESEERFRRSVQAAEEESKTLMDAARQRREASVQRAVPETEERVEAQEQPSGMAELPPECNAESVSAAVVRVLLDRNIDPALVESIRGEVVELFEQPGFAARAAEMSEWRRRELLAELSSGCVPGVSVRTPLFEPTVRAKVLATVRGFVLLEKEEPATPRAIAQVAELWQAIISRIKAEFPGIEDCQGWDAVVAGKMDLWFLHPQQSDMTPAFKVALPEDVFARVLAAIRPAATETPEINSAWIRMNDAEREESLTGVQLTVRFDHWIVIATAPFIEMIPQEVIDRRIKAFEDIGGEAIRLSDELSDEAAIAADEQMRALHERAIRDFQRSVQEGEERVAAQAAAARQRREASAQRAVHEAEEQLEAQVATARLKREASVQPGGARGRRAVGGSGRCSAVKVGNQRAAGRCRPLLKVCRRRHP